VVDSILVVALRSLQEAGRQKHAKAAANRMLEDHMQQADTRLDARSDVDALVARHVHTQVEAASGRTMASCLPKL